MNKIGLSLTINKYSTYFECINNFLMFDTLEDAKNELINILVSHYKKLHIDFPQNLVDFEYELFNHQYIKADAFTYKLFQNNKWEEPWETQDIYDDIIDKMIKEETDNPPEFSEIYGEPDPDENIINKFTMENDECYQEMENKLKEIINQSSTAKLKEDQVKDCKCKACQDGYQYQISKKEQEDEHNNINKKDDNINNKDDNMNNKDEHTNINNKDEHTNMNNKDEYTNMNKKDKHNIDL